MTEKKICPFMSKSLYSLVRCQGDDCMAWREITPVDDTDTVRGGYCELIKVTRVGGPMTIRRPHYDC